MKQYIQTNGKAINLIAALGFFIVLTVELFLKTDSSVSTWSLIGLGFFFLIVEMLVLIVNREK